MPRFKNILLYTGTEENGAAIKRAIDLARENAAELTLIDVIKPMPATFAFKTDAQQSSDVQQLIVDEHLQRLAQIASECMSSGVNIQTVVRIGDPAVEIVRRVIEDQHDLVIKTADGVSTVGRLFGSVARSLMRLCPCPVWVLKPEIHGELDMILAAVDLETGDARHADLNRNIVSIAASIAARDHAKLQIVSAWDLWMESSLRRHANDDEINALAQAHERKTTEAMHRLLQETSLDPGQVTIHLSRGSPARIIQSTADKIEADLLVMGTVCRTGVAGFLIGNTAESILTDLTCSVLALKPDGFRSPVELTDPLSDAGRQKTPRSLV